MSASPGAVRQRGKDSAGATSKQRGTTPNPDVKSALNGIANGHVNGNGNVPESLDQLKQAASATVKHEWDYKLAFAIITLLAFATRFYGITHPNAVVFDEVHFGKVRNPSHYHP